MIRKPICAIIIIIFCLVIVCPRDIHPKLFLISLFIRNQEAYEWAENYCSKYGKIDTQNYCRSYITDKYKQKGEM